MTVRLGLFINHKVSLEFQDSTYGAGKAGLLDGVFTPANHYGIGLKLSETGHLEQRGYAMLEVISDDRLRKCRQLILMDELVQ